MVKVVFLMGWDSRMGPRVLGQYPTDYPLDKEKLIDLFGLALRHGESAHFSEVELRGEKAVLYFTGMQTRMSLGAIMDEDDNIGTIRGALTRIVLDLIVRGQVPHSIDDWKRIYDKITLYGSMTLEEKVGELFSDMLFKRLFDTLLDWGLIRYDMLLSQLSVLAGSKDEDIIRAYLEIMNSLGLIQLYYDEEAVREYIFLLRDVAILRRKPELYDYIKKEIDDYEEKWEELKEEYLSQRLWMNEQEMLAQIFANPELYKLLMELRKRGVISIDELRNEASHANFLENLKVFGKTDSKYYLLSDVVIALLFPRYSIHQALGKYSEDVFSKEEILKYLDTLKKSYL